MDGVRYRVAFGEACRLAEALGHDAMLAGRARLSPAAGGTAARILAEVVGRFGDTDEVREGTADALAGDRPRW